MSVPKNFIIRCPKCRWARMSTGLSADLADLYEIKTCTNCGGARRFRCPTPNCPGIAKQTRIKNNG